MMVYLVRLESQWIFVSEDPAAFCTLPVDRVDLDLSDELARQISQGAPHASDVEPAWVGQSFEDPEVFQIFASERHCREADFVPCCPYVGVRPTWKHAIEYFNLPEEGEAYFS